MRESGDDSGHPPLLLLHGWFASGGLNWLRAFDSLTARYRVLAPDFRGHARGGVSRTGFSIAESADDMGALLDALAPGKPAIVIGYSMGGMIAQELWRRHRDLVGGLVLSATSCAPVPLSRTRTPFSRMLNLANSTTRKMGSALSIPTRLLASFEQALLGSHDSEQTQRDRSAAPQATSVPREVDERTWERRWARREFARHHWPTVLDAGRAIAEFDTRDWIREVDVPTTVMLTKRDRLVPPHQQRAMASRIPDARIETVDAGHFACVRTDFGARILRSVRSVERSMA